MLCSAVPTIHGISNSHRVAQQAAERQLLQLASLHWKLAVTSGAQFEFLLTIAVFLA
jgi:hypothetical protein